jgi:hypothetical protein
VRLKRALLDGLGRVGAFTHEAWDALRGRNDWSASVRWAHAYWAGYRAGVRHACDDPSVCREPD